MWTDRQTDMVKLVGSFLQFLVLDMPKKVNTGIILLLLLLLLLF
jgi:hypothetical protein